MPKVYDVVKAMSKYTDAQGQEKTRWLNCGVIFKNAESGKMSLKMEAIPYGLPDDQGWFALMEPQPRQQPASAGHVGFREKPAAPAPATTGSPEFTDDDIPF